MTKGNGSDSAAIMGLMREFHAEARARMDRIEQKLDLYHGAVVGHGIAITELQERVARIEARLERIDDAR